MIAASEISKSKINSATVDSMAQTEANLTALYGDLNRFGQNQEYERALRVANKILQQSTGEAAAFHCKIVCLVKLDRFSDALTAVHKEKTLSGDLKFEKAYCEYRLNRTQEAIATLRSADKLDNRCKELLAQVLYRLEEYSECYDLYRDLIKNSEDEFDEERETNLAAVLASLQMWDGQDMEDPGLRENTYELCYNQSCYLVGRGDYKGAQDKLRKAEALCKESFSDDPDVTEEEVEEELAIIRVQLAYIQQRLNKSQEALGTYNQVLKKRPSDVGLMAVLSNNVVAINKDQNVFDSKKKMKVATGDSLKHKLTSKQRQNIDINQCLLHMYANQADQCRALAKKLQELYPDSDTPLMIQAAQLSKDRQTQQAIQLLEDYIQSHPEESVSVQLLTAQLLLAQGSVYPACDILKGLGDLQYRPGVVSALVTLYMSQEDKESAAEVLSKSVDWLRKNEPNSDAYRAVMRSNTNFQVKHGSPQQAAKMLEELRKSNRDDPRVIAQLISAYSKFDPAKAQKVSRDLPSVDEVAQSVDVDNLEMTFSTLGPKYMKKVVKTEPSPGPSGDMLVEKKKSKKKKRTKLPKNYNPDVIPDPERWLPRRERSYYRGKRKDKRKDIGKGTQGATGSGDMESTKSPATGATSPRAGSAASTTSPGAGQQLPQGPRQQRPAQQKKKKKKGGSKW